MHIALVSPVRMENNYLREFVEHYAALGVDRIVLIDNNDADGERPEDAISSSFAAGLVETVDKRGMPYTQGAWLQEAYDRLSGDVDWVCLFDVDEFLEFRLKNETLHSYLGRGIFDHFDVIRIPWRTFGDNGLARVENGNYSLKGRFTSPIPMKDDRWCRRTKAILRAGAGFRKVQAHGTLENCRCCDYSGIGCKNQLDLEYTPVRPCAVLNHYRTKTLEEFLKRRVVDSKYGYRDLYANQVEFFFQVNECSDEKVEVLNQIANQL